MIDILNRFLIQNKSISIPGLGTIHAERIPARMDAGQKRLIAPAYRFRFDKYFDAPDKNFFTYLSMQKQIPDYEAIRVYNQFAQDFRSRIMLKDRLEWDEIGYFQKNSSGEVEFFETDNIAVAEVPVPVTTQPGETLGPVPLVEEILLEDDSELLTVSSPEHLLEKKLFVVALVLLAVALIAAGIQFGTYGLNAKAWANRQPFSVEQP